MHMWMIICLKTNVTTILQLHIKIRVLHYLCNVIGFFSAPSNVLLEDNRLKFCILMRLPYGMSGSYKLNLKKTCELILTLYCFADDNNRPFLTSRSPGTNDYINAVYVDVSTFAC